MENDTGSWRLFAELAVHTTSHYSTLPYTSYADNLQFIKNNRLNTHQFKQQTSPVTRPDRDKSNGQF